jgi:hypothetical protein
MCEMVTPHIATDQAQVQPQSSPFGIYVVDRVALGQIFLEFSVSPFSYDPTDIPYSWICCPSDEQQPC